MRNYTFTLKGVSEYKEYNEITLDVTVNHSLYGKIFNDIITVKYDNSNDLCIIDFDNNSVPVAIRAELKFNTKNFLKEYFSK